MTHLTPSSAKPADIDLYTQGSCHVFALALHRAHGMRIVLATQPDEPYWVDEADADNFIAGVLHVYAVDDAGNAWDVRGVRPRAALAADLDEHYVFMGDIHWEECRSEAELATWVDGLDGDDIDRPLHAVSDDDVAEAQACIQDCLAHLPGFPERPAAPVP